MLIFLVPEKCAEPASEGDNEGEAEEQLQPVGMTLRKSTRITRKAVFLDVPKVKSAKVKIEETKKEVKEEKTGKVLCCVAKSFFIFLFSSSG